MFYVMLRPAYNIVIIIIIIKSQIEMEMITVNISVELIKLSIIAYRKYDKDVNCRNDMFFSDDSALLEMTKQAEKTCEKTRNGVLLFNL